MEKNIKNKKVKETKKKETPTIEKINLSDYVPSNKEKKKGIIGTIILIVLVGILLFGDLFDFSKKAESDKKESGSKTEEKDKNINDDKEIKEDEKNDSAEKADSVATPSIGDTIKVSVGMSYSVSSDRAVLNVQTYAVSESNYYVKPNQEVTVNYIAIVGADGTIYGFSADSGVNAQEYAASLNLTNYNIVYHVKTDATDIGWIVYNQDNYSKVK